MFSALSTFNTMTEARTEPPTAPRAPQQYSCLLLRVCACVCVCVCVHYCVCVLGWVKCRAQIPSTGHHTWPHNTSLQNCDAAVFRDEGKSCRLDEVTVDQWCPTLFLEIYLPAEFSSNPDQTRLNQLIKIFRST